MTDLPDVDVPRPTTRTDVVLAPRMVARATAAVLGVFVVAAFLTFVVRDGGSIIFTVLMAWFIAIAMEPAVVRLAAAHATRRSHGPGDGRVRAVHRALRHHVRPTPRRSDRCPAQGAAGPRQERRGRDQLPPRDLVQLPGHPHEPEHHAGAGEPVRGADPRRRPRPARHRARRRLLAVHPRPAHLLPLRRRPPAAEVGRRALPGAGPGGLAHGVGHHGGQDRRLRRRPCGAGLHQRGDERARLLHHRHAVLAGPGHLDRRRRPVRADDRHLHRDRSAR